MRLPERLRRYFWDTDFDQVTWKENFGYIVNRLLEHGSPDAVQWLRDEVGDEEIRAEIVRRKARGLAYRHVAPWIPRDVYDEWVAERPPSLWQPG